MGEKGKRLLKSHRMGSKCSKPMHALLKHTLLHMQVPMCDTIVLMGVEKDPKTFLKFFEKLKPRP
jgi:hypothetical protein